MNIKMFSWIKKSLRHSMKRIKSKNHKIGIYEIKISLPCFDDKIHILDNGIYVLDKSYFNN